MENIFNSGLVTVYETKWSVKSERLFSKEEIDCVEVAQVVPGNYGNSVKCQIKPRGYVFFSLSPDSTFGIGDIVDLSKVKLVTLTKPGEKDTIRIENI